MSIQEARGSFADSLFSMSSTEPIAGVSMMCRLLQSSAAAGNGVGRGGMGSVSLRVLVPVTINSALTQRRGRFFAQKRKIYGP